MKVATRITLATAVVVTLTTAVYAFFDLRARERARMTQLEREVVTLATSLRIGLEATPPDFAKRTPAALSRDLTRGAGEYWTITVIPRLYAAPQMLADPPLTPGQQRRLHAVLELPKLVVTDREDDGIACAVPLRAPSASGELQIIAAIDVQRSTTSLEAAASEDLFRAFMLVTLIATAATIAVAIVAVSLVSRRIRKLLSGIDDVAKGDLSHVLLSDREDEIGAITTRFNEMTFSLRESRAETQRQNQAKHDLEQRLGQTEKLATIGQLAAEIAHEVGTPLNVIAGRARATQRKSDDKETVEKNSEIIAEQTARITRIIQRLLDFARRKVGSPHADRVQLNAVTLTTMELLAGQFSGGKIRTRLVRAEGLPWVAGDADRLQQVLINLLLNAVQAMPDGGKLELETMYVRRTRPGLDDDRPQDFVCLRVSDSGAGIPAEIREKIFDPFYTTKEGQGGTGLGLAVCSGIVKEHDGWIEIADGPSGGTTFSVYLPAGLAEAA